MPRSERESGTHPTPPRLAGELVGGLLADSPRTPILDPACGEGELLLAALAAGVPASRLFGIEIDPERAQSARRRLRERGGAVAAILCGDALSIPWPAATSILANPPWVSFSGRQSRQAASCRTIPRLDLPGNAWPSLHGTFLVRIAKHLSRNDSRGAVLIPASLCELERYGPVRREITSHARLTAPPRELGESAFPGVLEPTALVALAARREDEAASTAPWTAAEPSPLLEALADHPRLPRECFADTGIHTGNSAGELLSPVRDARPGSIPVREGRDLDSFHIAPARRRIRTDLERSPARRFRIPDLERHLRVPILVRQTAGHPIAALHIDPTFFRNTLLAVTPPEELDPAFVVAALNSPVARAFHRLSFQDARQRTFPQVKISHLRSLPFPFERRADDARLHDRIASISRSLSRLEGDDPKRSALLRQLERELQPAYDLERDLFPSVDAASGRPIRSS